MTRGTDRITFQRFRLVHVPLNQLNFWRLSHLNIQFSTNDIPSPYLCFHTIGQWSRIFYPAIYFITITLEYKPKTEMQLHFVELSRTINHVKLVLCYALITLTVSTLKSG